MKLSTYIISLLFVTTIGCSMSPPPEFRLNTEGRVATSISDDQAKAIRAALRELFGTPDRPVVPDGVALDLDLLTAAAGPIGGDAEGKQWGLFRRHCAACHGLSGDGAGPSAAVLNPYPRDFRNGVFKYTSTAGGAKPTGADLLRTLREGLPGTAMPSFHKLPDHELGSLVEYVKYLSIRGETELYLLQAVVDDGAPLPVKMGDIMEESVLPAARSWANAQSLAVVPPPPVPPVDTPERLAASIARGRELFGSAAAQCVQCHGPAGDGRGQQSELYDTWNQRKKGDSLEKTLAMAARFRLPIERLHPRDFTRGQFHGGDRPIDQYWRICVGIKGTPMPAAGPAPGSPGALTPEDIWHVVNYVRSLAK